VAKKKRADEADYAADLEEILKALTHLRSVVDKSKLPDDAKQELTTHLALASISAHKFRLTGDDDIIVFDE
jgi:hypothetical protein